MPNLSMIQYEVNVSVDRAMAVSTELALRQAAFFITTFSFTTSLQPNKWSFIVSLCDVLPLFLLRSTKLLTRSSKSLHLLGKGFAQDWS